MKNPGLRSGKAQIVKSRKEVLPKMSNKNAKQDGGRNRQGAAFLNAKQPPTHTPKGVQVEGNKGRHDCKSTKSGERTVFTRY